MKYVQFIFVLVISVAYFHYRKPLWDLILSRVQKDCQEVYQNHSQYYKVNKHFFPKKYADLFIQSNQDEETTKFLENSCEKSNWFFRELTHLVLKSFLQFFVRKASLNGWLHRGSMFVISTQQFRHLLGVNESWSSGSLLHLGAGDGHVTGKMAVHFERVFTTETSQPMVARLHESGFKVLGIDNWSKGQKYDVISCLNFLDRCGRPKTLLQDIKKSLHPVHGRLILAVVTPFKPFVEFGGVYNKPFEHQAVGGNTFEEQVLSLIIKVIQPAGFEVEKFTKVPYLCEGDLKNTFYKLTDVVFVLKPAAA